MDPREIHVGELTRLVAFGQFRPLEPGHGFLELALLHQVTLCRCKGFRSPDRLQWPAGTPVEPRRGGPGSYRSPRTCGLRLSGRLRSSADRARSRGRARPASGGGRPPARALSPARSGRARSPVTSLPRLAPQTHVQNIHHSARRDEVGLHPLALLWPQPLGHLVGRREDGRTTERTPRRRKYRSNACRGDRPSRRARAPCPPPVDPVAGQQRRERLVEGEP